MPSSTPHPPHILTCILLIAATLAIGCEKPSNDAAEKSEDTATAEKTDDPSSLAVQYENVGDVLQLKPEEFDAIQAIHGHHKNLLETWQKDSGAELKKIRSKALKAAKNKDLNALRKMNASGQKQRVADLTNELRGMKKAYEAELLQALPADKLNQWKTHVVSGSFLELLKTLNLSPDQIEKVKTYAAQAAVKVKNEPKWLVLASAEIAKSFASDVTPAQMDMFKKLKVKMAFRQLAE